ncbi:MAG TPA: tRNA (adenosine(37)-N6)-threonylcarbamoyltransferase complex dimerization subunit type 1 TsaB [Gammaproteobacteria bacterium]|nr:tRNA (adenosine(37)-N6)-threonylcarbamoyltransferase complex dimerization subunit type 1 TsaB [Gammaproteobacteria bacterium]HRF43209.1 tRNA (adenosine(37)-N6)-threonylcarbamoyltransferase complex dimerization subunit type 1 TsaB [Candidatus Competibacteraceae bacterium]
MKLLALETATEACSAAVWIDGAVFECYELAPRRHAALILPMIEMVLAEAGLTIHQLDALAVGRGPGAFTGVRIAIGVVQGMAFASDLPVAPISTLAALALGTARETGQTRIAAALDARMGEVYWGTWAVTDEATQWLAEEQVCAPSQVTAPPGEWFGAGSGWTTYSQILSQRLIASGWKGDCYPRAGDVARLAADPGRRSEWLTAEQVRPVYLRNQVVSRS